MQVGLQIFRIYEDTDIVEFAVLAWNGFFGGAVNLYLGQGDLEGLANTLRGFPQSASATQTIELGTFDPAFAGGGARLRFYIRDRAGHVGLEATLQSNSNGQRVCLIAGVEPAAIDRFIEGLVAVNQRRKEKAELNFDGAINRA